MTTTNICYSPVKGRLPRDLANFGVQRNHKEVLQRNNHPLGRLMGKFLPKHNVVGEIVFAC